MFILVEDDLKTAFPYFTASLATFRKISELMVDDIKQTLLDCGETEIEVTISLRYVNLKADQAKYFTSENNQTHFNIHGITFNWVGVYSSRLACYAERVLGTILGMAFKCRHHANAPKEVWDLAVLYNWGVYDNWPHSGIEGSPTPKEARGQGLDNIFEFLHIFWAVAAAWIPKSKRGKGESKCAFGRYAGYDRASRSHWIVIPFRQPLLKYKIIRTQHAQVDPRPFPARSSGVLLPQVLDITPALNRQADQERARTSNKRRAKQEAIVNVPLPGQSASVQPLTKGWTRVDVGGRLIFINKFGQSSASKPPLVKIKGEAYTVQRDKSSPRSGNTVSNPKLPALLVPTQSASSKNTNSSPQSTPATQVSVPSSSERPAQVTADDAPHLSAFSGPTATNGQPPATPKATAAAAPSATPAPSVTQDWRVKFPVGAIITAKYLSEGKNKWYTGTVERWITETLDGVDVDMIRVKFSGAEFENFDRSRADLHHLQLRRGRKHSKKKQQATPDSNATATLSPATDTTAVPAAAQLTPAATVTSSSFKTPNAKRRVQFDTPSSKSFASARSHTTGRPRRGQRKPQPRVKLTTGPPIYAFDRLEAAAINAELSRQRARSVTTAKFDDDGRADNGLYNSRTDQSVRQIIDIAASEVDFTASTPIDVRTATESPDGDIVGYAKRAAGQPEPPPDSIDYARLVTNYADNGQDALAEEAFMQAERHGRWVFADANFIIDGDNVYSEPITGDLDADAAELVQTVRRSMVAKANESEPLPWTNKVWYSYKQAAQGPTYGHIFKDKAFVRKEVDTLERHGTITVCPRSATHGHKLHRLLVLISLKRRGDPTAPDYLYAKLRIVFDGKQAHAAGIASTNIPGLANVRLFFSFQLEPEEIMISCDVPCAYSQTERTDRFDLDKRIYAELPYPMWPYDAITAMLSTGYIGNLYGRIDAGLQHEIDRNKHLNSKGYRNCKLEPAFIIGKGQRSCVLTDDFITIGTDAPAHEFYGAPVDRYSEKPGDLKKEIVGANWTSFNGALIRRIGNQIQWSTRRAIEEALARANATDVHPSALPSPPLKSITKHETQRLDHIDDEKRDFDQARTKQYMKNQGSHIWVSQLGRADVAVTVSQNASVMAGPSIEHAKRQAHLYRYLKFTKNMVLTWDPSNHTYLDPDGEVVHMPLNTLLYYTDGSYGAEGPLHDSRMGYVCIMNGGVVAWGTQLLRFRSTGVMDVEEAAACWGCKDAVYRRELCRELGFEQLEPSPMLCDNMATISFSRPSATLSSLSKHILIRGAYTRECQTLGIINLIFCPGRLNASDGVTKVLDKSQHYGMTLPTLGYINIPLPSGYQPPKDSIRTPNTYSGDAGQEDDLD